MRLLETTVTFNFQGKSGVEHTIGREDRRLAKIVARCRDLPGYELFQYLDNEGNRHSIDAADVNDYPRGITEQDFTARDFRTWAGTVLACTPLREFEPADSDTSLRMRIMRFPFFRRRRAQQLARAGRRQIARLQNA